jgi:hypothetical protein
MTGGRAAGARLAAALLAAAALAAVAVPFFTATTFVGDDHLFLAFARHAPSPLVPFVRDQHGGEYYRPLPMALWWVLGRVGGGSPLPFAAAALILHAGAAALLGALVASLGRARSTAALAAAIFLVSPQNLEAAYWYAASADVLAAVLALGALVALVRERAWAAAILAAAACLSKEPAVALPLLGLVVLGARPAPAPAWARRFVAVAPLAVVAIVVAAIRHRVLGGWGGAGDERASLPARLAQIASGLAHVWPGSGVLPDELAWIAGGAALLVLLVTAALRGRRDGPTAWAPLAFAAAALLPTLAAGWIVGARYFYLSAAGLSWAAAEALAPPRTSIWARGAALAALIAIGGAQAGARRADVAAYRSRLGAVRRAIAAGAAGGHRVFHVACGIKDLDLAVKQDAALGPSADRLLVLGDVPASFVMIPPDLETAAAVLVARPPLPPSGAYAFGDRRIVGLARRGDDPDLEEVVRRFPDIRFLRLRRAGAGSTDEAGDVTDEVKRGLE